MNDVTASVFVFAIALTAVFAPDTYRTSPSFRILAATGSIFLWTKTLSIIKGMQKNLATFIHALSAIVKDLKEFMAVL